MNSPARFILPPALLLASACSMPVHQGAVRPIQPQEGHGVKPPAVESLAPTFRWTEAEGGPCTYDFAIWDVGEVNQGLVRSSMEFLPYIYYREALARPEHTLELPLAPDTGYFWSVRVRREGKTGPWATHDAYIYGGIVVVHAKNYPYRFRTPAQ